MPIRALPAAGVIAGSAALAWLEYGSIAARDWLPYALLAALLLAVVLVSGAARIPTRLGLAGAAGLLGLAGWTAISLSWSPAPANARDEALLVAFYAVAVLIPLLTLDSLGSRIAVTFTLVAATLATAIGTAVSLVTGTAPWDLYAGGRLAAPIGYWNAQAAAFLVAFWPAVALAARRLLPVWVRVVSLSAAAAVLAGWLLVQSRGGAIALAASAVVVFAVAPGRLRLIVPTAIAGSLAAVGYLRLTRPFRDHSDGLAGAALGDGIRDAGRALLWITLAAAVAGLVYAVVDRRVVLGQRIRRSAGALTVAVLVAAAGIGVGKFLLSHDDPAEFAHDQWAAFKRSSATEGGSSHLLSVGSDRYDYWRVALNEFRDHPLAGIGARGWGTAYLREGKTETTPERAHSLELDQLSETGVVGFALLLAALGPLFVAAALGARAGLVETGILGGVVYWLIHASGDWLWTLPAASLPFFVLLAVGAVHDGGRLLPARWTAPLAGLVLAVSLLTFLPPLAAQRFTSSALRGSDSQADDLRWARRLDPLSVDPLVAESALASSPAEEVRPLERAVELEPRSAALRYLLAVAYLEAGRPEAARSELVVARALSPRDDEIAGQLERIRDGGSQ